MMGRMNTAATPLDIEPYAAFSDDVQVITPRPLAPCGRTGWPVFQRSANNGRVETWTHTVRLYEAVCPPRCDMGPDGGWLRRSSHHGWRPEKRSVGGNSRRVIDFSGGDNAKIRAGLRPDGSVALAVGHGAS